MSEDFGNEPQSVPVPDDEDSPIPLPDIQPPGERPYEVSMGQQEKEAEDQSAKDQDYAALKQQVTELRMMVHRLVEQHDLDFKDVEQEMEIHRLQEKVELLEKRSERPPDQHTDPARYVWCGEDNGTNVIERAVNTGTFSAMAQGRTIPTTDTYELEDGQAFYWQVLDFNNGAQVMRQVKIAVPTSGTESVLIYITANRTMGGSYKGYIIDVRGFPPGVYNETIDSSSASFTVDDILADAAGVAAGSTTAEEVTVLNQDETGLTTHALTAATQIKYIVLARATPMTDSDNDDCRVFICGDSDSETCA